MKRRLTKQDRAQCIWLLREAKKILKAKSVFMVCGALYKVNEKYCDEKLHKNWMYLNKWIYENLEGCISYSHWLRIKHPKLFAVPQSVLIKQLLIARFAWLDWMINELENGR